MVVSSTGKTPRRGRRNRYSHATHRLRELERIIRDRHGATVPDTDDADCYIVPAALCFRQMAIDRGDSPSPEKVTPVLKFWCEQWAPAFCDSIPALVTKICGEKRGLGKADQLGKKLRLLDTDRTRLSIRTIGAYDVDRKAREKRRLEKKRKRDRERARAKRAAKGAVTRAQYLAGCLSQSKPWEVEDISRRTYERRRKAKLIAA